MRWRPMIRLRYSVIWSPISPFLIIPLFCQFMCRNMKDQIFVWWRKKRQWQWGICQFYWTMLKCPLVSVLVHLSWSGACSSVLKRRWVTDGDDDRSDINADSDSDWYTEITDTCENEVYDNEDVQKAVRDRPTVYWYLYFTSTGAPASQLTQGLTKENVYNRIASMFIIIPINPFTNNLVLQIYRIPLWEGTLDRLWKPSEYR